MSFFYKLPSLNWKLEKQTDMPTDQKNKSVMLKQTVLTALLPNPFEYHKN